MLEISEKVEDTAAAIRIAKKRLREKNEGEITASFSMVGDVQLVAGVVVQLSGFQPFDPVTQKGRVKFFDKNGLKSSELKFIAHPRHIAPEPQPPDQKVDEVKIACDHCPHVHKAYLMDWNPETGVWVLCIMRPDGSGDGYLIGEV